MDILQFEVLLLNFFTEQCSVKYIEEDFNTNTILLYFENGSVRTVQFS